ncbi:GNAT family N-acetyltransferase [Terrisporobacter glycolicus]
MNHLGTIQIETDRLKLRKFNISDSQALFNNWANDMEVTKFLTWSPIMSVETAESILSDWIESYSDNKFYQQVGICMLQGGYDGNFTKYSIFKRTIQK